MDNNQYQGYNNVPNQQINMRPVDNSPITVGQWILTFIILAIPIVNIIMLFVWGFSGDTNISKKNYAKATLILVAIGVVLSILLSILGVSLLSEIGSQMNY